MKIILVQLIVSILSVQSSVIPISTNAGITIIHAPPPGQSIAIQAPVVPNSIALIPVHTHIVAEIPPSKIPAAVTIAESPITIPQSQPSLPAVVVNTEGVAHSIESSIPAVVSIADIPLSNISDLSDEHTETETPESDETPETPDPETSEHSESHNDDDGSDDGSTPLQTISLSTGSAVVVDAPAQTIVAAPAQTVLTASGPAVIAGPTVVAGPTAIAGLETIAAPAPSIAIAQPAPVLLAAEGTYLAKTRGSEHFATLSGHINSASSINLEPAPGTI